MLTNRFCGASERWSWDDPFLEKPVGETSAALSSNFGAIRARGEASRNAALRGSEDRATETMDLDVLNSELVTPPSQQRRKQVWEETMSRARETIELVDSYRYVQYCRMLWRPLTIPDPAP